VEQQERPPVSSDGQWFWDGVQWRSLLSADGRSIWDGAQWAARPGAAAELPTAATEPPATPVEPPGPARPDWLAVDAPRPWHGHTAAAPADPLIVAPGAPPAPPEVPPGAPPAAWDPAPPARSPGAPYGLSGRAPVYAGFWIRFLANLIDSLIYGVPLGILTFGVIGGAAFSGSVDNNQLNGISSFMDLVWFVVGFGYFVYFWSAGATLGMRFLGLRVVDANSMQTIGLGQAMLRFLGYLVSLAVCYIGLIWAAFDGRKQGWHDKIAGTLVVHA